jgi:GNAT superfamily N-acetyltransferase
MDTRHVTRRILEQRRQRFPNTVPSLGVRGEAPYRLDGLQMRVAFARAGEGAAERLVAGVIRYCAARGFGVQWTVMPSRPGEAELLPALLAHGFLEEERQRLMAHQGPLAVPANPRMAIHPIISWQDMVVYESGSRAAFFDDPYPVSVLVERRARERLQDQEQGWCRYIAGYLDGQPVGGCYYTRHEDVPTIMGVYTIPSAQRQGAATALLARAVGDLLAAGSATCCLYVRHGNPAERLYRRLGFEPLLDEYTCIHESYWP